VTAPTRPGDERVVPLYALARGPGNAGAGVTGESVVTTTRVGLSALAHLRFEQAQIVDLCRRPTSVAEVAAHLRIPAGVAGVLVAELQGQGMVTAHVARFSSEGRSSGALLDRLLPGLDTHRP
jgi:hypothetical protein